MAITMMVMMMAITIFPFQQASALSTKIAMYIAMALPGQRPLRTLPPEAALHNLTRGPLTVRCIGAWREVPIVALLRGTQIGKSDCCLRFDGLVLV